MTGKDTRGHWLVLAPFFKAGEANRWIDDFVAAEHHSFEKLAPRARAKGWHGRRSRGSGLGEWLGHWRHAWRATMAVGKRAGIITVFPQLPLVAAVQKRLLGKRHHLVAWCFNIGKPPGRAARAVGRWAFAALDCVIVHSRAERQLVAEWFGLPLERVLFFPLQRGEPAGPMEAEDADNPFLLALGSANRDYATFFAAVGRLGYQTIVVASPRCIEGLSVPSNVSFRTGLAQDECYALAQKARINIIPVADVSAASGQVTVIDAMRFGKAIVATRNIGITDYIEDGAEGILVAPGDEAGLAAAIETLWEDSTLRTRLGEAARHRAISEFSDRAAGRNLSTVLDMVESGLLP